MGATTCCDLILASHRPSRSWDYRLRAAKKRRYMQRPDALICRRTTVGACGRHPRAGPARPGGTIASCRSLTAGRTNLPATVALGGRGVRGHPVPAAEPRLIEPPKPPTNGFALPG
jgi:hypothetical protein